MPKLVHRELILADIETTYQDGGNLTGANAIMVGDLDWSHEGARMNERERVRYPSKGTLQQVFGGTMIQLSFNVELKGSGSAGDAPEWGVLMRMCGLAEETSAGTSVTYAPATVDNESGTLWYYEGSLLRKIVGVRGNVELESEAGGIATLAFTLTGHTTDPDQETAGSIPEAEYDDSVPSTFRDASVTMDGFEPVIANLSVALGNEVATPADANAADGFGEVVITRRNPSLTLDPESVDLATYNFVSKWKAGDVFSFDSGVIGSAAGNRWQLTAPAASFREIAPGDRDGIRTRDVTLGLAEDQGDDEFELVLT